MFAPSTPNSMRPSPRPSLKQDNNPITAAKSTGYFKTLTKTSTPNKAAEKMAQTIK